MIILRAGGLKDESFQVRAESICAWRVGDYQARLGFFHQGD
jgi:hypothetical protein